MAGSGLIGDGQLFAGFALGEMLNRRAAPTRPPSGATLPTRGREDMREMAVLPTLPLGGRVDGAQRRTGGGI